MVSVLWLWRHRGKSLIEPRAAPRQDLSEESTSGEYRSVSRAAHEVFELALSSAHDTSRAPVQVRYGRVGRSMKQWHLTETLAAVCMRRMSR
jgi:hypothetical protein